MGMGMGLMMPAMFAQYLTGIKGESSQGVGGEGVTCQECHQSIPMEAKFCPRCGHQQVVFNQCGKCGKNLTPAAKFCSRCGQPVDVKIEAKFCDKCGSENLSDSMFCNQCGEKL